MRTDVRQAWWAWASIATWLLACAFLFVNPVACIATGTIAYLMYRKATDDMPRPHNRRWDW